MPECGTPLIQEMRYVMKRTFVGVLVLLAFWSLPSVAQTPTSRTKKPPRVIDNDSMFAGKPSRPDGMAMYENTAAGYGFAYPATAVVVALKDADIALEMPESKLFAMAYSMPFDIGAAAPTYRGENPETSVETPLEPWKYLTTGQCNAAVRRMRTLLSPKSLTVVRRERLSNFSGAERYLIRLRMTVAIGDSPTLVEGALMLCGSEKGIVGLLAVLPVERFKQSPDVIESFLEAFRVPPPPAPSS